MTTIESKAIIAAPVERVYSFLENCHNHKQLQPDTVDNWTSTYDEATFTIQNMATFSLKIDKRIPYSEIVLLSIGKTPFDVSLTWKLVPHEKGTEAVLTISAELNMMMKMLASAPLQKLGAYQVSALKKLVS